MRFIVFACINIVLAKACEEHITCGACIRDARACKWCEMDSFSETRCISEKSAPPNWCPGQINNPTSKQTDSVKEKFSSNSDNIVQIRPQKISMKLRPGQSVMFNFSYYAAEHYPVDLYFLYHATMPNNLWEIMNNMPDEVFTFLQDMTKNASLGFGTFIDKNKVPFMSVDNSTLAYSFQHHFKISNDYEKFKKVKAGVRVQVSQFNDDPEGGLDALAQVLACDDVGWRKISRKIVVFSTDRIYHAAGDGTAAGIIYPYDGKCYLEKGRYSKEKEMDYPSPSIINKLASDRDAIIIFVIANIKEYYENLMEIISGARVIDPEPRYGQKASVASELKTTYRNIIREIKLKVNKKPIKYANKFNVSFDPECDKGCEVKQSSEKIITGKITLLEYFEMDKVEVDIAIQGIKEKLTLDIEIIKDCECKTENGDGDRQKCSGQGIRRCGVCECDPLRSGSRCECSTTNSTSYDRSTCIAPNTLECNGRGSCICGVCKCTRSKRYEGKFCECDLENCPRDKDGNICGHGDCLACTGECRCHENWSKTTQGICNCDNSRDACITGPKECFDYGECKCNECKCPATLCEWDARSSQDDRCRALPCSDCHTRQCHLLESYALTNIQLTKPCQQRVNVTFVKKLGNETSWMRCSDVRADVGCYTEFAYKYDDDSYKVHVIVQSEYNCAESAYIYGGVCLGTLISGGILALAIWKMVTVYRDTKEYRRFLHEHEESLANTQPLNNVLYSSPFTSISNPNYRQRSFRCGGYP